VPYINPPNASFISLDYSTVYLSWDEIGPQHVPGTLLGYQISYREYFNNNTGTVRIPATIQQRTLTGLKPYTHYWVEISGYTIAGLGPESLVIFKTPPGRKFYWMFFVFFLYFSF